MIVMFSAEETGCYTVCEVTLVDVKMEGGCYELKSWKEEIIYKCLVGFENGFT